jgi:N-acetylmuramoyl-L-alanine amidase
LRALCAALVCTLLAPVQASDLTRLENVRVQVLADKTRVVLDLSQPAEHRVFALSNPPRAVIDLDRSQGRAVGALETLRGGLVRGVRTGMRAKNGLRVVLDLEQGRTPTSFTMSPSGDRGHRVVIDLATAVEGTSEPVPVPEPEPLGPFIIAIDAGHGGKDPGALGSKGTREKDITLAVARRLKRLVDEQPGMRAVLTRSDDRFLHLRERILIAREHQADLFLSIHADSYRDRRARGSSVFILSRKGASSEAARWLADRENAADLVGGANLTGVDREIQGVVLDMLQEHTIGESWNLAQAVLVRLKNLGEVHKDQVERAGFAVLKSPDIPSVLVETAFLSNPTEERRLRDPEHQDRLARAVMAGLRGYADSRRPLPLEPRLHVVRRGETLMRIAEHYSVSVGTLRTANGIEGDLLHVGARLSIPGG